MNTKLLASLALLVLTGWAAADVPRKAPLTKYRELWLNSPFTTKPPPDDNGPPPPSVLNDYALAGVSPIKGGYRVTIINKKNPDERKYVYSDQPNASHGFTIVSVERKKGDLLGTVVHMRAGTQEGTVSYDEKFLTIAAPPAAAQPDPRGRQKGGKPLPPNNAVNAAMNNPHQHPAANPPQGDQQNAPRAPRPRVIGPPPAPQPPEPRANKR